MVRSRRPHTAISHDGEALRAAKVAVPGASKGWSEQERRILIVTFVGGLAANVGAVILVGAAVAFVHHQYRAHASLGLLISTSLLFCIFGSAGIAIGHLWIWCDPGLLRGWRLSRTKRWLFLGAGWLAVLESVLILTGIAAGVK